MTKRNVLTTCAVLVLGAALFVAFARPYVRRHIQSVTCGNQMSSIGCGALTFAWDNSNRFASDFQSMSNELCSPRFLICPSDRGRTAARNWESLDATNSSYEIVAPGMNADDKTNAYFRCTIHGHLGFADGTVFDGWRRRTKTFW